MTIRCMDCNDSDPDIDTRLCADCATARNPTERGLLLDEIGTLRTRLSEALALIAQKDSTLRGCSSFLEVFIAKGDEEGAGSMLYKEVRAALSLKMGESAPKPACPHCLGRGGCEG